MQKTNRKKYAEKLRFPCGFVAETLRNDQSEKRPDSRIK
ncbi:hypothetical protein RU97_GL001299 [Enterococcus canis]|uniref:Uncharacterized protein n=1 Tax=Enterococcus canis TaxID=214095 RepID=A0A1L8RB02_9ENTE|nr:hypothetical protein RU97_GL001299 [Enterococcus canis]